MLNDGAEIDDRINIVINSFSTFVQDYIVYLGNSQGLFSREVLNDYAVSKLDNTNTGLLPLDEVQDIVVAINGIIWCAKNN